jgi:DNA-binding GntR family transcriptional regulator
LTGEGFLEESAGRGLTVATITKIDIAELYELREAIEVFAVGKAAKMRMSVSDEERLQGLLAQTDELRRSLEASGEGRLDASSMQKFIQADLSFHTVLLHAASNRRMLKLVNETRLLIRVFSIQRGGHTAAQLRGIQEQHEAILDLVLAGKAEEATRMLAEHIRLSGQERLDAFEEWEREQSLALVSRLS